MGIAATKGQQTPERRRLRATSQDRAVPRYFRELHRAAQGVETDPRGSQLAKLARKMINFPRNLRLDQREFLRDAVQLTRESPVLKVLDTAGGFLCFLAKDLKNDFSARDALKLVSETEKPSKQEKLERDYAQMVLKLSARTSERAHGNKEQYDPDSTYSLVRHLERSAVKQIAYGLDPNVGAKGNFYRLVDSLARWAELVEKRGSSRDAWEDERQSTRGNFNLDARNIAGD